MSVYYVRKHGDDGNGGTNATTDAVLTLNAAYDLMIDDDTMDIGVGTWTENIDNATAAISLTIQGAGMWKTTWNGYIDDGYGARSKNFAMKDLYMLMHDFTPVSYSYMWFKNDGYKVTLENVFIDWNGAGAGIDQIMYGGKDAGSTWTNCIMCNWDATQSYSICNAEISGDHCTFYRMAPAGGNQWRIGSGGLLQFTNSIFYTCGTFVDTSSGNISTINILNCVTTSNWSVGEVDSLEGTLTNTDALLRDPDGGDFRLHPNSPAIGMGVAI